MECVQNVLQVLRGSSSSLEDAWVRSVGIVDLVDGNLAEATRAPLSLLRAESILMFSHEFIN